LPIHQFHDEAINGVGMGMRLLAADVVQRADVWMVEPGDGTRLLLESLPGAEIPCDVGPQNLDWDKRSSRVSRAR
jgi:hypothetical protein